MLLYMLMNPRSARRVDGKAPWWVYATTIYCVQMGRSGVWTMACVTAIACSGRCTSLFFWIDRARDLPVPAVSQESPKSHLPASHIGHSRAAGAMHARNQSFCARIDGAILRCNFERSRQSCLHFEDAPYLATVTAGRPHLSRPARNSSGRCSALIGSLAETEPPQTHDATTQRALCQPPILPSTCATDPKDPRRPVEVAD